MKPLKLLALGLSLLVSIFSYADDYYWVGGSGNWSDLNHWATSSGGTVIHNTIPGSSDDIFFDSNSGSGSVQINVNVNTLYGRDFTIVSGAPVIEITNSSLFIELYGSVSLQPNMVISSVHDIKWTLAGAGSQTINSNGVVLSNITILSNGHYKLINPLSLAQGINIQSGSFYANGHNYTGKYFYSSINNQDTIDFSNTTLVLSDDWSAININNDGSYNFSNTDIYVSGINSEIRTSTPNTISFNNVYLTGIQGNRLIGNNTATYSKVVLGLKLFLENVYEIDTIQSVNSAAITITGSYPVRTKNIITPSGCEHILHIQGPDDDNNSDIIALNSIAVSRVNTLNLDISGAAINATNSYDIGGSSGISFSAINPSTYYWVGGSGQWSDANHWSLTSGGTPSGCVPGILDHVIFDANSSSQSFEVGMSRIVHVGDFISTSLVPVEFTGRAWIYINGSLKLNDNSTIRINTLGGGQDVFMTNNSGLDSIECKNEIHASLYFLGSDHWIISDTLKVEDAVAAINGNIHMPNTALHCNQFRDRYYPEGGGLGDSTYMNITNSTIYASHLEFREYTFNWDIAGSTVYLDGNYIQCYFDQAHPFWNFVINAQNSNATIHWDAFTAKRFEIMGRVKVNSYQFDHEWDTLRIHANSRLTFDENSQNVNIEYLDALSNCYGYAVIESPSQSDTARFNINSDSLTASYLLVQNIVNATPSVPFNLYSSADMGGNKDISFHPSAIRTLYWVSDGGSWNDSTHWSLTSGGMGGECLPTPSDSVVFDMNSFSNTSQVVDFASDDAYCKDFYVAPTVYFEMYFGDNANLQVYGSMVFQEDVSMNYNQNANITFRGPDSAFFQTKGVEINVRSTLSKTELGSLTLVDSIHFNRGFLATGGQLHSNNQYIQAKFFSVQGYNDSIVIHADSSKIDLTDNWNVFELTGPKARWIDYKSKIFLWTDRCSAHINISDTVDHIEFINENVWDFNSLHVNNYGHVRYLKAHANLQFYGSTSVDTLILSPDQVYSFENNQTHTIHDSLWVRGDFCHYIGLKSTLFNSQADIITNNTVTGDFLEIRDLAYIGNQTFYTGDKSNDQGNNSGFIWSNTPGYIYGFPSDTLHLFCHDSNWTDSLYLGTQNFNDAQGFHWSTGDSTEGLWVNQSGSYWVVADYLTCEVSDTINVTLDYKEDPIFNNLICRNTTATVSVNNNDSLYQYDWSTGDTSSTLSLLVLSDTSLSVDIYYHDRYMCSDTIFINAVSIDSTLTQAYDPLCHNDANGGLSIQSIYGGHGPYSFQWPHDPTLTTTSDTNLAAGCYPYLITDTLGCMYEDSICLSNPAALYADFIVENPFCEGQNGSVQLLAYGGTPAYTFDIAGADTTSLPEGTYAFTVVDANGCETDTSFDILHTFDFYYSVQLDTATCGENNGAFIVTPYDFSAAYTYSWSNYPGYFNNGQIFMPPSNGYLYITDTIAGCIDSVYYEIPTAGISNATFLSDLDSGVSPLTIQTTNLNTDPNLINYWIINGDTISNAIDTAFVFPGYGNYLITHCLFDPVWGCTFCFEKEIIVLPNPDISVPNFFTPNYDGTNDFFELAIGQDIDELVIDIYNRWGNLLFHSNEVNFQWDATMPDGGKASDGVYLWTMTYREVNGQQFYTLTGTVTIMDSK